MNYLHGIEYLTKDNQGFVYWKERPVEHYSYADEVKEKIAAQKLATDCKLLESDGLEVSAWTLNKLWEQQTMATFPPKVRKAANAIASAYGIRGVCDQPHIANLILEAVEI